MQDNMEIEKIKRCFPIGTKVVKVSGKPFKSGEKKATIKGYCFNLVTDVFSFTFEEDDSNVEWFRCEKK